MCLRESISASAVDPILLGSAGSDGLDTSSNIREVSYKRDSRKWSIVCSKGPKHRRPCIRSTAGVAVAVELLDVVMDASCVLGWF
jgi:hypothetical protein